MTSKSITSKATALMAFIAILSTAVLSSASDPNGARVGSFDEPTQIASDIASKKACKKAKGTWTQGACLVTVNNNVTITAKDSQIFQVSVSTVSLDRSNCSFEGEGQKISDTSILAQMPIDDNKSVCEVTVDFKADGSVKTSASQNCQMFCGTGASLDIEAAR